MPRGLLGNHSAAPPFSISLLLFPPSFTQFPSLLLDLSIILNYSPETCLLTNILIYISLLFLNVPYLHLIITTPVPLAPPPPSTSVASATQLGMLTEEEEGKGGRQSHIDKEEKSRVKRKGEQTFVK